jgi:hypothetical protein
MNLKTIKGPKTLSPDTPIYRYISEDTAIKMFDNKTLRFNVVSSWNDKIEGIMFQKAAQLYDNDIDIEQYFGNCWTTEINEYLFDNNEEYKFAKNEIEEDGFVHMWESYCRKENKNDDNVLPVGIRIKSTVGKILNLLNSNEYGCYHGLVYYKPLKLFSTGKISKEQLPNLFFYKKMNFIHENEYRFIIKHKNKHIYNNYVELSIKNILSFVDDILISPEKKAYSEKIKSFYNYFRQQGFEYKKYPYNKKSENRPTCRISQLYGNHSHE